MYPRSWYLCPLPAFFSPLSSVPPSSNSSPEAVLAPPKLAFSSRRIQDLSWSQAAALPGSSHCPLRKMMDRCLHGKSMTLGCAGGATKRTGCVTVDRLSIYKVSQHQDSPENPHFSTWPVRKQATPHWSILFCDHARHGSIPQALPKQLAMCGCLNTRSLPIWKSISWPLDTAEISQVATWLVFSATKTTVWIILNLWLCSSFCVRLISQVFTNQLLKFQNILAILWPRSTSLSFSGKSMGLEILLGLYEI